jgi:tRNA A-37 threonylcarbamoyl transferase component Bud32
MSRIDNHPAPTLTAAGRSRRRRRPTGEPPPLPHHLQTSGVRWMIAAAVLVTLTIVVFARGLRGAAVAVTLADDAVVRWLNGLDAPGLVGLWRALAAISSWWVINALGIVVVLALLAFRRFRQLIFFFIAGNLMFLVAENVVAPLAQRPRPFGVVIRAGWGGWALPSLQILFLAFAAVAILYTLVPEGRWRNTGKWVATVLIALAGLGRVALGAEAPTDVLLAAVIGVTLPLLAFRLFVPNEVFPITYRRGRSAHLDVGGARGLAIRRGLEDQLGLNVQEVKPFGLSGSAGSTPLRITIKGDPPTELFGKLYARSHLRSDRWYKLGRELLYGRLEDEKPFNTVRRLVQQEDYALSLMQRAGLPSPAPFGFVELTPEREYLLVAEFFAGAVELGEAEVDDQLIDDGLQIVRKLWDAGLAHRDIKPANLLVRDGRMLLIDVAFVEARPSPWRQAVDLANMMLCLALRSSPEQVYRRALQFFTVQEITEAFAPLQLAGFAHTPRVVLGLALPSQLSQMQRAASRDPYPEFIKLLPSPPKPIRMQRWSARRIGLWAAILALLVLAALNPRQLFDNEDAVATPLGVKNVGCGDLEPLWLMAQSVPSASLIPCLQLVPVDWTVAKVAVNNGRSVITLDHDRGGKAAMVVRLSASCDLAGATEVTSEQAGARRYLRVEPNSPEFSATRAYTFPGGCVTHRFTAAAPSAARLSDTASTEFGFITREELGQALSQRSHGRLELDP